MRETTKAEPRKANALSRRRNPALMNEAETMLADIRTLWRNLFRNPFDEAKETGLTGPQVAVMACLVTRGPLALTELSRALSMSHSTASGIVDRLQQRGMLQRREDEADRRRTAIAVTDSVAQYVRQLEAGPAGRLVAALQKATPNQRRAITKGVTTLRRLLDGSID